MVHNGIIGRSREQEIIRDYCNSGKAELIAVYGRRRVGKTYLVRRMFDDKFAFSFTGMYEVTRAVSLEQFRVSLEQYSHRPVAKLKDWFAAFEALRHYLESLQQEQIVVFLDELPWLDTPKSNFLAAFSFFWNNWASTVSNLKLLICGSSTTWMLSHIIGDKGGLYGRVSRPVYLAPFNLGETELFLREIKGMELSRRQVLDVYMVLGGIPYYLDMIEKGVPLDVCIDHLFFAQGAPLRGEFDFLFRSLFKDSLVYRRIVEILSSKMRGMSRKEIMETAKLKEGGKLTEVLANLLKCDFIRKYSAIGKSEREAQYQLTDMFSLFHIRFVAKSNGQDEHFWSNLRGDGSRVAWSGYAFEQICLHHIPQLKRALGIFGILSNVCSWACLPFVDSTGIRWKGGQIDLLIDRNDGAINVCEMKYADEEYVISAEYEQRLQERASLFRQVTKTKKTLLCTFVTTYGVKKNMHSGIVQSEVKIDDLFDVRSV